MWLSTLLSVCFAACADLDAAGLCGPSCAGFLASPLEGEFVVAAWGGDFGRWGVHF